MNLWRPSSTPGNEMMGWRVLHARRYQRRTTLLLKHLACLNSYGFGSVGKPKFQIPPDADLQYEIKLKSFEKVPKAALLQVQRGWGDNWPQATGRCFFFFVILLHFFLPNLICFIQLQSVQFTHCSLIQHAGFFTQQLCCRKTFVLFSLVPSSF